jgi:hypothetical protein
VNNIVMKIAENEKRCGLGRYLNHLQSIQTSGSMVISKYDQTSGEIDISKHDQTTSFGLMCAEQWFKEACCCNEHQLNVYGMYVYLCSRTLLQLSLYTKSGGRLLSVESHGIFYNAAHISSKCAARSPPGAKVVRP